MQARRTTIPEVHQWILSNARGLVSSLLWVTCTEEDGSGWSDNAEQTYQPLATLLADPAYGHIIKANLAQAVINNEKMSELLPCRLHSAPFKIQGLQTKEL